MDGQGLQTLKPPPSVIHCHPAIISESLIHFVCETLLKASLLHPFVFVVVGGRGGGGERSREKSMQKRQVNSSLCCFKALSVL